jgi:uncharacterized protein
MARVVHFEIHCADVDRAERFYSDVFGWDIQRWEGGPYDYRLVTTGPGGEVGIDGALVKRRRDMDGDAVIASVNTIGVDDLDEIERRVAGGGGSVVVERHEIPCVGHMMYFKDTEGNIFGALQRE